MLYCPTFIPVISLPVAVTYTESAVSSSDLTTYTFSAKSFSTAAANRKIVVGVMGGNNDRTLSSATIGGVTATNRVELKSGTSGSVVLIDADVPTGTTGDVVITWSAGQTRCGIGIWAMYNAGSSPNATASNGSDPMQTTLNIPANGAAFGCAWNSNGSTFSWTNLTEKWDQAVEGANTFTGASDLFASAQVGLTITCTPTAASDQSMVLMSYGP